MYNKHIQFEFDASKEAHNIEKHGINFEIAKEIFLDPEAIYASDAKHSQKEERWYAVGKTSEGKIITVWYTFRKERIRIIGAAEIRKWRKEYEKRKITQSQKN